METELASLFLYSSVVGLVGRRDAGVQLGQRFAQCAGWSRSPSGPYGHQQRKEPSFVARRVDVQIEFGRIKLRPLLVRRQNAGLRAGDRDRRGEIGIVGMQHVKSAHSRSTPRSGTPSFRSGHIHAQFRGEAKGEVGGVKAVKLEEHHRACPGRAPLGENMICRTVNPMWRR